MKTLKGFPFLILLLGSFSFRSANADTIFERLLVYYNGSKKPQLAELGEPGDWAGRCVETGSPDQFRSAVFHLFRRSDEVLGSWFFGATHIWRQSESYAFGISQSQLTRLRSDVIDAKIPFMTAFSDGGDALISRYKTSKTDEVFYLRKNKGRAGNRIWVLRIINNDPAGFRPDPTQSGIAQSGETFSYCYFNTQVPKQTVQEIHY